MMDWADEVENDDGEDSGVDVDMILPPFDRIHEGGFVYEISFHREDDRIIRRCRKTEKKRRQRRIPKAAIARQHVQKFGQCAGQERGLLEKNITETNTEEAAFHWTYTDTMKEERDNVMRPQRGGGKGFPQVNLPERRAEMKVAESSEAADQKEAWSAKFRPRHMDGGLAASLARDQYELRISNVPFQTEKAHVYELIEGVIGRFARTDESRPRVKERTRGEDEKHFYVQFKEAQHAVDVLHTLNGYHYGHMVMLVEWSRQSKKPEGKLKPSSFVASGKGGGGGGRRGGGGGFGGSSRSFGGGRSSFGGGRSSFGGRPRDDGGRGGSGFRGRGRGFSGDDGGRGRGRGGSLSSRGRGFSARRFVNSSRDGSDAPKGPNRRGGFR